MDGKSFRLALARTVLFHKPKGSSLRSHFTVLQAAFPRNHPGNRLENDAWRKRVTELEGKLDEVQAMADAERTELLALRAAATTAESQSSSPPSSAPAPTKKRSKKASNTPAPAPPSTAKVLVPQSINSDAVLIPHLRALDSLTIALSTKGAPRPPPSVILATSRRCIEGLGQALSSSLVAPSPTVPSSTWPPTPTDALDATSTCLPFVLDIAIPSLLRAFKSSSDPKSPNVHSNPFWRGQKDSLPAGTSSLVADDQDLSAVVDAALEPVVSSVVIPVVQALSTLCQARAQYLLSPTASRHLPSPRPLATAPLDPSTLLPVLSQVSDTLDKLCRDASSQSSMRTQVLLDSVQALRDRVVLYTLRQLDKLVETPAQPTSSPSTSVPGPTPTPAASSRPRPTQAERIKRIARKDALQHLCTTLSLYLRRPVSLVPRQSSTILREEIGPTLGVFVRKHLSVGKPDHGSVGSTLDEMEQNMIMAVLEHAWVVGVRMGGEDWEGDDHDRSSSAGPNDADADADIEMKEDSQT